MTPLDKLFRGSHRVEPIRILIADDEPRVRSAIKHTFESDERFSVVGEASDGAEAVTQLAATKPDVVVLDLAMPNMNGMEAIPELLKTSPRTKIVVFSSWVPFDEMGDKALAKGASLVIDKFTSPRKLLKAVARLAEQR